MSVTRKITINDVASAAGVSKGTVDRVIHNRGEVSAESRKKVLDVIEALGYRPNIYASVLASRKNHKIVCPIPEYSPGDFWETTCKGIAAAQERYSQFGVSVHTVHYDQYEADSFRKACAETFDLNPSGVVLAPMFREDTLKFTAELKEKGISYIYIDSRLEDPDYMAYFGMDTYKSGYLCADIHLEGHPAEKVFLVRIARDREGLSDPTKLRRTGFMDYISRHCPDCKVENVFINPNDIGDVYSRLDSLFSELQSCDASMAMLNSHVYLLADY